MRSLLATPLLFALASVPAAGAPAGQISLRPRFQPGDAYVLSLSAVKNAEVLSQSVGKKSFREDVHLRYEANVVVLETDAAGIPVRERHQDVMISFVRPDSSGSLFDEKTSFEVRRQDGAVQIFVQGERAEPRIERVVRGLLEDQFEYGVGGLLDPGRPVAVGESWEIESARAQGFLRAHGVEGARLGGPATASLEQEQGGPFRVRYRIPIASFAPGRMPANGRAAHSEGQLEGEALLDPGALHAPLRHSSRLVLSMHGSVHGYEVARPFPWSFRSSESLDQHTVMVRREVASQF